MADEYIEKICARCGKKFNWEWTGYKIGLNLYCGRSECEKSKLKPLSKEAKS